MHLFFHLYITGFRGRQEVRQLKWGDIVINADEHGRYLRFRERTTKTRQGESNDSRDAPPVAYENKSDPSRCPVRIFELFTECRPERMLVEGSPFFLGINNMVVDPANQKSWYKNGGLGKNSLGNMMQKMAKEVGLEGKFCNHTVRKTGLTNLLQAGVPPTYIKRISGHKNEQSISHYATASKAQVKLMNEIMLNPSRNVPKFGQIENPMINTNPIQSTSHASPVENEENSLGNVLSEKNFEIKGFTEMTSNQKVSGLLHNATLANCTFNISYSLLNDKK